MRRSVANALAGMLVAAVACAGCAGCASTNPEPAFRDVAKTVTERSGKKIRWDQATPDDREADRAVRALLEKELTVDAAVQIALLRNPRLLATFEDLAIAQADLVQAGLLKNPVFSANVTTAERDALDPNLVFGVTQDFLDLFMLPARKKIAGTQLEAVKMRVADAVLDLAAEARSAYFAAQGAMQVTAMRRVVAEAAQASLDMAAKQHEAGNISDLSLANERALYEQSKLDLARGEADVLAGRERLTRAMGLFGAETAWRIPAKLPELPKEEIPLDRLESRAIGARLDLQALEKDRAAIGQALSLAKDTRWTGVLNVGVDVARLKDKTIVAGPGASLELPIFDQRQAQIAKLEAFARAADQRVAERALAIRSEVRTARDRVVFARRVAEHYRAVLIPLRERIVQLSQEQYDAMLLGVYQLIAAKQAEVSAYRELIVAVRDYWLARSDRERPLGGGAR